MTNSSDTELLREYVSSNSEAAFGEIVRRYADAVHSAALRQVGNPEQARDVAQSVFIDLARKAGALRSDTMLIGWLFRGVRLAALELMRKEQRRQQRERQAMDFHDPASESAGDWAAVRPVLDDAIGNLDEEDRNALLLRFFKNESLASVGATLGISEDAAQKRISRALGKLRESMVGRGIHTTAGALSGVLAANAVQAAPAGFAASMTAAALAKTAVATGSMASILNLSSIPPMKTLVLILALAGGVAGLALKQASALRELRGMRILAQQLAAERDALRAANEQLSIQTNDLEKVRGDLRELLRLRNEVGQLRRQLAAAQNSATGFEATSNSNNSTDNAPGPEPQIHIRARFILASTNLNLHFNSSGTELEEPNLNRIEASLGEADGIERLSEAEVLTLSGRQAQIQMLQSVTNVNPRSGLSTVYTNVGVTLDVLPTSTTNSQLIGLTFVATVNDVPQRNDISAEDGSHPALVSLYRLSISNTMVIPSGHAIVLGGEVPAGGLWTQSRSGTNSADAVPGNLLVFLTPTLVDAAGNRIPQANTNPQPATLRLDSNAGQPPVSGNGD